MSELLKIQSLLLLVILLQVEVYAQKHFKGDEFSIIKFKKRGVDRPLTTKILKRDSDSIYYLKDKKNTSSNLDFVSKIYSTNTIRVYNKNKFNYKTGFLLNINFGLGGSTPAFNVSLDKRFKNNFEFGIGSGIFSNYYYLPVDNGFLSVISFPFYANCKYILNKGKRAIYIKGRMGYAINRGNFNIDNINNGLLLEPSIGLSFSSKNRIKHFIQLGQHISNAEGSFFINNFNDNIPTIGDFNIWFNGTMLTYGIQIGK